MDCYFCIVNLPGKMGADVCVLAAKDDGAAMKAMAELATRWIGFETIFLYYGERFVGSLVDDGKGFATAARTDTGANFAHRGHGARAGQTVVRQRPLEPWARKTG